jgi:anti-sigma-K factor RskA
VNSDLTPELSALAAELALGVLEGKERAEALRQSLANPAFAAAVRTWQAHFDPLGERFAESPPPNLWPAIEARLDAEPRTRDISKIRFWRTTATLTGTLAAGLAAVMVFSPAAVVEPAQPSDPVSIAQLAGENGAFLAANLDPNTKLLSIRAVTLPESALVPELWIIPKDGVPRSLGLFKPDGTTQIIVPAALNPLLVDGTVLAVSLELAEGAPHTAPSSTPIAMGKISTI